MKDDKKKQKRVDVSKFINLEPNMNEAKTSTAVLTFGRFSPPTVGHEKLVNKIMSEAKARKAIPLVFTSHTFDKKKNPLPYDSKIAYLQKAFGPMVQKSNARTIIEVAKELNGKFGNLVVVVGSDRVPEFQKLLTTYNGREYNYESIEVISAGDRDPDADDVSGMSASKLRALVVAGDFDTFQKGLPTKLKSSAKDVYSELRKNMGLEESVSEELEESTLEEKAPLTIQQRRQRAMTMKRYASRIARARERAQKRKASPEKLKVRARRKAKEILRQKILKQRSYKELTPSEKIQVDKRLQRIPKTTLNRLATRQLPTVRKAEMERLASLRAPKANDDQKNESLNGAFENFLMEMAQPQPVKRFHTLFTKEGTVKHDKRFKFNRKKENPHFKELEEEPSAGVNESFLADAKTLMEEVESLVYEASDGYKADPKNREHGTDSLVKILKGDTPGQKNEAYFDTVTPSTFGNFTRGSRVRFSAHSLDMADGGDVKEGTVVGSTVQHLRVRSDEGILYKVRHKDARLVEAMIVSEDFINFDVLTENLLDKAVEAVRKHVTKGKSLEDVIWDFSAATGFKVPTKELYRHYIKIHGDPRETAKVSDKSREALIRKYM